MPELKIAPSILSADFACLSKGVAEAEAAGADYIHVDVMDGHFVPNLTFGPLIVAAIRRLTTLPLDVHLMITEPDRYLEAFADAGADGITVHAEACRHLHRTVQAIRQLGKKPGVAINPATSPVAVEEVLDDIDVLLVMSVNPGFPGQRFIDRSIDKLALCRAMLDRRGLPVELEVDGGISPDTAERATAAGARVLVAGTAVYHAASGVQAAVGAIRAAATRGMARAYT